MSVSFHSFEHGADHARELASALDLELTPIDVHIFPDGESLVRAPSGGKTAIIYCPLDRPNEKLVNLLLAADALQRGGARRLVLVAPYLCYMRQDKAFRAGEAISQKAIAQFLSLAFDRVVTVDAHLHRVNSISEVFPDIEAENLLAADAIARYVAKKGCGPETVVVGPDVESAQWVARIAGRLGAVSFTATKSRSGDRDVEIVFPAELHISGRDVLLADDIVSSGGTMIAAISALRERGAASIRVAVTHALFDDDVLVRMRSAGASEVWSSTAVPHATNAISISGELAEALRDELNEQS